MTQKYIALLGRRDEPTDAVEEYCEYLGHALAARKCELTIERVKWAERGWKTALEELEKQATGWAGRYVLVQYTALAWSMRGFPLRFLRVLKILRTAGVRTGVVYHDVFPFGGDRLIDKARRQSQLRAMRSSLAHADFGIFTVALEKISWAQEDILKATFIPVGANLPDASRALGHKKNAVDGKLSIAVYGVTGGSAGEKEIASIAEAVAFCAGKMDSLRLVVMGRNSDSAEERLRKKLKDDRVEIAVKGILPAAKVVETLLDCDILLFVRGPISTRRGSAIAGIACGLPVIAFAGPETAPPITDAGVELYDPQKPGDLAGTLLRVLKSGGYRASLAERSREAQEKYFSWKAIAARYAEVLRSA